MARYDDTFVDRFLEPWNRCGARAAALSVPGLSGCFHHGTGHLPASQPHLIAL